MEQILAHLQAENSSDDEDSCENDSFHRYIGVILPDSDTETDLSEPMSAANCTFSANNSPRQHEDREVEEFEPYIDAQHFIETPNTSAEFIKKLLDSMCKTVANRIELPSLCRPDSSDPIDCLTQEDI